MFRLVLSLGLLLILSPAALAQGESNDDSAVTHSGLPIPRFVSLKSDFVNVRVGPGKRYPISWVYRRAHLPVEVIEEFGHWRKVRDHEQAEGWIHKGLLDGQRTVMIRYQRRPIYIAPDASSAVVMEADPMVIAQAIECDTAWCKIEILKREGWIRRDYVWGLYNNEQIQD